MESRIIQLTRAEGKLLISSLTKAVMRDLETGKIDQVKEISINLVRTFFAHIL